MLMRLMMILCLLVVSAVPVWAGEKDAVIESSSAPIAEQMTIEEALAKVTITAEDRLDGDVYHIRYTFTNPTDVYIEKDILYTEVYLLAYWNDTCSLITKVDNSPNRHLSIAPHSETTMVLSFPKEYTHERYSYRGMRFQFAQNDSLGGVLWPINTDASDKASDNVTKSDPCPVSFEVKIIPPAEGTVLSELLLTVDNRTSQAFHTIKDLRVSGKFYVPSIDRKVQINFGRQGPIEVSIPPHSQTTIPFTVLTENADRDFRETYLFVSLDDKHYVYTFDGHSEEWGRRKMYLPPDPVKSDTESTRSHLSYYIENNKVHCFFKVHNPYDKHCFLPAVSLGWYYLTPFCTEKNISKVFWTGPQFIRFRPNETKYYTFSFDLPPDYFALHKTPLTRISFAFCTVQDTFHQTLPLDEQRLSPLQRVLYQPLPYSLK